MSATTEDREPVRRALGLSGRALIAVTAVLGFALISQVRLGPGPDEPGTTTRPGGAAASGDVTATPAPTPKPVYAAVFDGDGTGETDVTAQLERFLESHAGEHVALEPGATYLVRELEFTVRDLTLDFRGARIITDKPGSLAIFHLIDGERVVLNDPTVHGTGFTWSGGDDNPEQWEAGIEINGGSEVTINRPVTRDTRGDGIYIGFEEGTNQPARDVVIVEPDIQRASRNGISPVAGEVTIRGGSIQDVGLHGIDFEPNNDVGALSIVGVVDGVDLRRAGALDVAGLTGYAIAAAGYSVADKPSLVLQNVTGDRLDMRIHDTADLTIRDNVSDEDARVYLERVESVAFDDNVRVRRN